VVSVGGAPRGFFLAHPSPHRSVLELLAGTPISQTSSRARSTLLSSCTWYLGRKGPCLAFSVLPGGGSVPGADERL
jgi:hypothetical protein